jgi:hypothetical protein
VHAARDCAWQAVGHGLVAIGLLIPFGSLPAPLSPSRDHHVLQNRRTGCTARIDAAGWLSTSRRGRRIEFDTVISQSPWSCEIHTLRHSLSCAFLQTHDPFGAVGALEFRRPFYSVIAEHQEGGVGNVVA